MGVIICTGWGGILFDLTHSSLVSYRIVNCLNLSMHVTFFTDKPLYHM